MNTLNKTRHLMVVIFMVAVLFGHFAGAASAADDATPTAEGVSTADATAHQNDQPADDAVTPSPSASSAPAADTATAPVDDPAEQPSASTDEGSGDAKNAAPTAEALSADEVTPTPEPAETKNGDESQSLSAANQTPVANDDFFTTPKDTPLSVAAPGVLANDTDPDGDRLTVGNLGTSTNGTVILNGDGSFVFTPKAGFVGLAGFTYKATDGTALSNDDTIVTIKVIGPNQPPVAADDVFTIRKDTGRHIDAPGVLANDSDPEGGPLFEASHTDPTHGTLITDTSGQFTYTPDPGFVGFDSYTYAVSDGIDASGATVTLLVEAPVATDDFYSIVHGGTLIVDEPGIFANDFDPNGEPISGGNFHPPSHGTLFLTTHGNFTYIPDTGFAGTDSFTYTFDVDGVTSTRGTATITVTGAPTANDDSFSTPQDIPLTVAAPGVLSNDTDPDGDSLIIGDLGGSTHGTVNLNGSGSFTFTPEAGFVGTASFTYKVSDDGSFLSNLATASIDVTANEPPVASDDTFATPKDTILTIDAPGLLANDSDPNDDPLVVSGVAAPGLPANGTIEADTLNADGSFRYLARPGFVGTDSFTYTVSDGGLTDVGTVTITVTDPTMNTPPVAVDDSYTIAKDTVLTVDAPGLLANDTDANGDKLFLAVVGGEVNGTIDSAPTDGSFSFTPNTHFAGTATFTYQIDDDAVRSNTATVTITVTGEPNEPPVANDDAYTVAQDTTLTVAAPGLLANDSDPNGDKLFLAVVGSEVNGTIDSAPTDGSFAFTPNAGFVGTATFIYQIDDDAVRSAEATVTITVIDPAGNQPPVAVDDSYSTPQDTPLTVDTAHGLLANDSDPDGDTLTAEGIEGLAHGTLDLAEDGSFVYTPDPGFVGTEDFGYDATDGTAFDEGGVTITVNAAPTEPNAPPTGHADKYKAVQDKPLTVDAATGVLANDSDPDGDRMKAQLIAATGHGSLSLNSDGSFTYTPEEGFKGKDQFTYCPSDGVSCGAPVSVQITVSKTANKSTTADPSPTADDSPGAEKSPSQESSPRAGNSPSAENSPNADSAPSTGSSPTPLSSAPQPTPKEALAVTLPSTGTGPAAHDHETTPWLPLAALAVLFVGCSAGFARRSKR
jgi:VCBS repeat-containing protein